MAEYPIFQRWSREQDQYLRDNWERRPLEEIARVLKRTEKAVEQRAYKLLGTTLDRDAATGYTKGRRESTRLKTR